MLFGSPMLVSSGFTPADLPNLIVWFDSLDTDTITESSGSVSQWDDKSGNGNHATQSNASFQPTLTGGTIEFDGVNDIMQVTNDPFINLQNFGAIAITEWDDQYGPWNNGCATYNGEGGNGWQLRARNWRQKFTFTLRGTAGADDPDMSNETLTDKFMCCGYRKSSSTRLERLDGTQIYSDTGDTGSVSYSGSDRSAIGGRFLGNSWSSPAGFLWGPLHQLVVINEPTDEDIEKLEGFLAHYEGIASKLPASHPFKSAPP